MALGNSTQTSTSGAQNISRSPRRIENAIQETDRAIERLVSTIMELKMTANRICGVQPEATPSAKPAAPPPSSEGDNLSTTLANLHAHLDTLAEQAERFEHI